VEDAVAVQVPEPRQQLAAELALARPGADDEVEDRDAVGRAARGRALRR
jgi:hypothetical protein